MMEYIEYLVNTTTFQICFKLLLSGFLAGIIGLERSSNSKPAGFGTHAIIGISSALIVIGSQYMARYYDIDASRIPAQILSGIGFIGAGTIIRNGITVRGVTTAAGILSVTCIGITVGIGCYPAAIIATIIVFLILSHNHEITTKFEKYEGMNLVITIAEDSTKAMEEIEKYFKKEGVHIQSIRKEINSLKNRRTETIYLSITYDIKNTTKNELLSKLIVLPSVREILEDN